MTFKKSSELDKDNAANTGSKSNKPSSAKESRRVALRIIGITLSLLFLITFWFIATIVMPLSRGSGAEKYTGQFRDLAEGIYEFESTYNCKSGCTSDFSSIYKIHIEDIHLTTDEERAEYCSMHPEYITTDPNETTSYTVMVTRYMIGAWHEIYPVMGCQTGYERRMFE